MPSSVATIVHEVGSKVNEIEKQLCYQHNHQSQTTLSFERMYTLSFCSEDGAFSENEDWTESDYRTSNFMQSSSGGCFCLQHRTDENKMIEQLYRQRSTIYKSYAILC